MNRAARLDRKRRTVKRVFWPERGVCLGSIRDFVMGGFVDDDNDGKTYVL